MGRFKKFGKFIKIGIVLAIVITAIVTFFLINSKPEKLTAAQKEEALAEILGRKPNVDSKVITGNTIYDGKYASFSYPARAKLYDFRKPEELNETEDEILSFDLEAPRLVLNYSVQPSRTDITTFDDIPAVKLRQDPSRGYTSTKQKADESEGLIFSKVENAGTRAEKSGFFLVNKRIYSISMTGNNLEDVTKIFNALVASINFK